MRYINGSNLLAEKYLTSQKALGQEQLVMIDFLPIINECLTLYDQITQEETFPKRLRDEFGFAIQVRDIEVLILLQEKIRWILEKHYK